MWQKNALFLGLCLVGLGWLTTNILRRDQIEPPTKVATALGEVDTVVAQIDREFQADWQKHGLQTAPRADALTIARRLSLALTGTVPSVEEIRALEKIDEADRVEWWLSYLLQDRRFADYVAERLARPMVGTEDGPFVLYRRSRFVVWLGDHLQKNTPYGNVVREIIADEGLWTDNPPVNFVSVTIDNEGTQKPDPIKLAARTSRTFLATRIDCLQCHDDNLGTVNFGSDDKPVEGKQTHFHEFAAFFGQTKWTRRGVSDWTDEQLRAKPDEQYSVQYLHDKESTVVTPGVPFYDEAFTGSGRRREQLARWITDPANKQFARATVNRLWALLLGKPLVDPVDDIPLNGPFPPGLETLAADFAAHTYDMHRLIRTIVATDAFQADSQADFEITDEHEQHWAVFPLTRLRPEQVAQSMIQAGQLSTIDGDAHIVWKLIKFGQTNQFVERYGDTVADEFTDRAATIPQRLLMMNGELVKERTQQNYVLNASSRIALLAPNDDAAVEAAYLAVFTRRPSSEELSLFRTRLEGTRGDDRANELEDLYWTLLNSSEFSWNH